MDKHTVDIFEEPLPQTNTLNLAMLTTFAKLTKGKFMLKQYSKQNMQQKAASYPCWRGAWVQGYGGTCATDWYLKL